MEPPGARIPGKRPASEGVERGAPAARRQRVGGEGPFVGGPPPLAERQGPMAPLARRGAIDEALQEGGPHKKARREDVIVAQAAAIGVALGPIPMDVDWQAGGGQ